MTAFYTSVDLHWDDILLRGYEDGIPIKRKVPYNPYLFRSVPTTDGEGPFRNIHGKLVTKVEFGSIKEARKYIDHYGNVEGFEIYGMHRFTYPFIFDTYPGEIKFDPTLIRVANIDIEVAADAGFPDIDNADDLITAITLKHGEKIYAFGYGEFVTNDPNVSYVKCPDEKTLLGNFLWLWNKIAPDVVTGWNIDTFDIPYLVNRITNVLGGSDANRLSPWRILKERKVEIHGKEHTIFTPVGIQVLDYLRLYKKFTQNKQESYRLDHIANVELGEGKLDYKEYGSLLALYKENHQKFMEYNIHDVVLVDMLDKKKRLLELVYFLTYIAKINMMDALTSVTLWDVIIHNFLLEKQIVVPFKDSMAEDTEFDGAFVKDPQVGLHDWVLSFDLTSLYPHLIMQYNISPETFIGRIGQTTVDKVLEGEFNSYLEPAKNDNFTMAANFCAYSKDQYGFMPTLMENLFGKRKETKDKQLDLESEYEKTKNDDLKYEIDALETKQKSIKVVLNALYGVLGNKYFRWFQVEHAEAITWSGQLVIQWASRAMNAYLNQTLATSDIDYVIAMDTDSLYVRLGDLVRMVIPEEKDTKKIIKFLHKVGEHKLSPVLTKACEELAEYVNAYHNKMFFKREIIAEKGIWTAKKRYLLSVHVSESVWYDKPKTKIVGIESVRSTTPAVCRKALKDVFDIILYENEEKTIDFITTFKDKYIHSDIMDLAIPTGVNGVVKYGDEVNIYRTKTPMHIKGALLYNYYREEKGLLQHPPIYDGDKIKMFYLKMPNPLKDKVICVPDYLPPEMALESYIDKEAMFDRSFLDPVTTVLDVIGWKAKKENMLF